MTCSKRNWRLEEKSQELTRLESLSARDLPYGTTLRKILTCHFAFLEYFFRHCFKAPSEMYKIMPLVQCKKIIFHFCGVYTTRYFTPDRTNVMKKIIVDSKVLNVLVKSFKNCVNIQHDKTYNLLKTSLIKCV